MATTQVYANGDGTTINFSFFFPYLKTEDIKVELQEIDLNGRFISSVVVTDFTVPTNNPTQIQFNTLSASTNYQNISGAPLANHAVNTANTIRVKIYRETNDNAVPSTFFSGSAVRAQDLNNNFDQNLYLYQELENEAVKADGGVVTGNITFDQVVTINKYPTADTDATNKLYVDTQDEAYDNAVRTWATSGFVNASGDQMTGELDMTNNKIVRLANPQDSSDAVNKQYVDGILVGSGGNISSIPVVRYVLTAVGGETVINPEAPIAPGNEIVTVNGSTLSPSDDYTINGTDSITLNQPLLANDQVMLLSYNSIKAVEVSSNFETYPFTRWVDTATAGQTVFQGLGNGTVTLGYSVGYESVALNGYRLTRDVDYSANDKVSVNLVQGAQAGDILEVLCGNYLKTGDQESYAASDISYTYPGGVPSNVQDRLEQYVSVKDFGAVGNGVASDTASLKAAINYAIDNNIHTVYVPTGVYNTTFLNEDQYNRLRGDGLLLMNGSVRGLYSSGGGITAADTSTRVTGGVLVGGSGPGYSGSVLHGGGAGNWPKIQTNTPGSGTQFQIYSWHFQYYAHPKNSSTLTLTIANLDNAPYASAGDTIWYSGEMYTIAQIISPTEFSVVGTPFQAPFNSPNNNSDWGYWVKDQNVGYGSIAADGTLTRDPLNSDCFNAANVYEKVLIDDVEFRTYTRTDTSTIVVPGWTGGVKSRVSFRTFNYAGFEYLSMLRIQGLSGGSEENISISIKPSKRCNIETQFAGTGSYLPIHIRTGPNGLTASPLNVHRREALIIDPIGRVSVGVPGLNDYESRFSVDVNGLTAAVAGGTNQIDIARFNLTSNTNDDRSLLIGGRNNYRAPFLQTELSPGTPTELQLQPLGKAVCINTFDQPLVSDTSLFVPDGPIELDLSVTISSGNGSPEGVVTANPGSLYLRRDGGANTCLYIKESNLNSDPAAPNAPTTTGWVAK